MKNFDLAPFWRSTVGFDRLFNMMEDDALRWSSEANYPPYNIERTGEDSYGVTLALAGFTPDDISITANYRNQFNRMISEHGFDGLMSAMREKQLQLRQSIGA